MDIWKSFSEQPYTNNDFYAILKKEKEKYMNIFYRKILDK